MSIEELITPDQSKQVKLIASLIAKGEPTASGNVLWEHLISDLAASSSQPLDVMEFVQYVLRQSYLEQIQGLQQYAEKVKHLNEIKDSIRDQTSTMRKAMQESLDALEDSLSTLGDDAQLANIDMQNWMQKVQQLIQASSNISKTLHDSAMAVIRNIK